MRKCCLPDNVGQLLALLSQQTAHAVFVRKRLFQPVPNVRVLLLKVGLRSFLILKGGDLLLNFDCRVDGGKSVYVLRECLEFHF
jgi:hypothetical protein